jgi:hypothetical protein
MQSKPFFAFLAAGAVLTLAAPASAQPYRAEAKLVTPAAAATATTVGETTWRCEGDTCIGLADRRGLDSLMKECRKVAAAVGPISAYSSRGRTLSAGNVAACNRLAAEAKADNQLAEK